MKLFIIGTRPGITGRMPSLKPFFQADMVFQHHIGTGYKGQLTKCRHSNKLANKIIKLDDVLHTFNHIPRKLKKQVKKEVSATIAKYKKEF